MNNIFERDLKGEMVSPSDTGYDELINSIWKTMKTAAELNDGYHTPTEVRRILGKIIWQKVDESVTLLPPFYVDYGKHIKIGKGCFIQQCCTFFGRGGITLGENVLVGPKVNIILSLVAGVTLKLSFLKSKILTDNRRITPLNTKHNFLQRFCPYRATHRNTPLNPLSRGEILLLKHCINKKKITF